MVSEPWSARQQRHLSTISSFTTDIQHVAGKDNPVANYLSRIVLAAVTDGLDFEEMARAQQADPEVHAYRTAISGLNLQDVPMGDTSLTLLCDISMGQQRPVVPANWRHPVFDVMHNLSHPGINTTCKLVSATYVWHGLHKQV